MLLLLLLLASAPPCSSKWDVGACDDACSAGDVKACLHASRLWQRVNTEELPLVLAADRARRACVAGEPQGCVVQAQLQAEAGDGSFAVRTLLKVCSDTTLDDAHGCGALVALLTGKGEEWWKQQHKEKQRARFFSFCPADPDACQYAAALDDDRARATKLLQQAGDGLAAACAKDDFSACADFGSSDLASLPAAAKWQAAAAKKLAARCATTTTTERLERAECLRIERDSFDHFRTGARAPWVKALCDAGHASSCKRLTARTTNEETARQRAACSDDSRGKARIADCQKLLSARDPDVVQTALGALCEEGDAGACDRSFLLALAGAPRLYNAFRFCDAGSAVACRVKALEDTAPRVLEAGARSAPSSARRVTPQLVVQTLAEGAGAAGDVVALVVWTYRDGELDDTAVRAAGGDDPVALAVKGAKPGQRLRGWRSDGVVVEVVVVGER